MPGGGKPDGDGASGPGEPDLAACRAYFGVAWEVVSRFAGLLGGHGVERGLIGPRETGRLWSRHLVNSGAVVPLLPDAGSVVDVGSGAGLPGIVVAAMRPDLSVELVEAMERRVGWLTDVVGELGLDNVTVTRARAEELRRERGAEAVIARAVAPLKRLIPWVGPLVAPGGLVLALKGGRASTEVVEARSELRRCGFGEATVREMRPIPEVETTFVVVARKAR